MIRCCSYEELLREEGETDRSSMQQLEDLAPFDICIFGSTSFSLLLDPSDRIAMLRLFRRLCPKGQILLSWVMVPPMRGLRAKLRQLLARITGTERQLFYRWGSGFYEALSSEEVERIADARCETAAVLSSPPFGYALFTPKSHMTAATGSGAAEA